MKSRALTFLTAGILSALALDIAAQNKAQDQPKKKTQVNTEQKTPVKIIQYIPGTWTIEQVFRGKEEITDTDTIAKNQALEFNREGRYMSYSGTEMIDSGAYRLNEDHAILYMASAVDDRTTEWNVWFSGGGMMTLQLKDGVKHGETFRYVYRRTGNTTSSTRD